MDKKIINVAFNINENYLPYCAVTMVSILKNANKNAFFNFYVFSIDNLSNKLKDIRFTGYENYKIFNVTVDVTELKDLKATNGLQKHVTIDTFLRSYIPKMLTDIDKCIILDVDLVVNTNIEFLYDIDLEGYYAAAVVENTYIGAFGKSYMKECREMFFKKYNIKDDFYFNTGVVLLNLKNIRDDNAQTLLIDTTIKFCQSDYIMFADQDCINIAYQGFGRGKIMPIDMRWNAFQIIRQPSHNIYIMHWPGTTKPWNNFSVPHIRTYIGYAKLTQFYPNIKSGLLRVIEDKLNYLNTKLSYKKYQRRIKRFDWTIFGKDIFPKTIGHCRRKIDEFLKQKREKELYYDYLIDLRNFLTNENVTCN